MEIKPPKVESYVLNNEWIRNADGALLMKYNIGSVTNGNSSEDRVLNWLRDNWQRFKHLQNPSDILEHYRTVQFEKDVLVQFRQKINGVPVDRLGISVQLDSEGRVSSLTQNTIPVSPSIHLQPNLTEIQARGKVWEHLGLLDSDKIYSRLLVHTVSTTAHLAYQINTSNIALGEYWVVYVDANSGDILEAYQRIDLCHSAECTSATGTGNVHLPDPVSTGRSEYGVAPFNDNDDASNALLESHLYNVTLRNVCFENNQYSLVGPNAQIIDENGSNLFVQFSSDFTFDRSDDAFEAVMCYYFIDLNMEYVDGFGFNIARNPMGEGVRFDPHGFVTESGNPNNAKFEANDGFVLIPDFLHFGDGSQDIVDSGEDAIIILHELAHALHHWASGEDHTREEGISEGLADYWGQSYNRSLRIWQEWDEVRYHHFTHWGLRDEFEGRTTNYTPHYDPPLSGSLHDRGRHLSTALMHIYDDIGREKTDRLFLKTLFALSNTIGDDDGAQARAATKFYNEAINLGYSDSEVCIVYNHLDDKYGSHPDFEVQPIVSLVKDIVVRDSYSDFGAEPSLLEYEILNSPDIWVRHEADFELQHQNPRYSATDPNYIYVRVHGRGCNYVTDAQLEVYFSRASTGLEWPNHWIGYETPGPLGEPILSGDLLLSQPINPIYAGDERLLVIPWMIDDPNELLMENTKYVLLARIVSPTEDPIGGESNDIVQNAKNNNNIALRSLIVIEEPGTDGFPVRVNIMNIDPMAGDQRLELSINESVANPNGLDQGELHLTLSPSLVQEWTTGGRQGSGYVELQDGRLLITDTTFYIGGLQLPTGTAYQVGVEYDAHAGAINNFWTIRHVDSHSKIIGGFTFEYRDDASVAPRSASPAMTQQEQIWVFPNPVNRELSIRNVVSGSHLLILDGSGRVVQSHWVENSINTSVDVSDLSNGLYFLQLQHRSNRSNVTVKFVKHE